MKSLPFFASLGFCISEEKRAQILQSQSLKMEYDNSLKAKAIFLNFLEENLDFPEAFSWRTAKPECLSPV